VKNLSIILNAILAVALIVLYVLHFKQGSSGNETAGGAPGPSADSSSAVGFTIAYVRSDSIIQNYQYVSDQNKVIEDRAKRIEQDLKNRADGLQKEFIDYQNNRNSLTIGQAQSVEEGLAKKEQNLRMFQERARQELAELEIGINRELYERLTNFLDSYSENNNIDMVVKFDTSSDVLYAGEGLDITAIVIENLNNQYISEKDSTSVN